MTGARGDCRHHPGKHGAWMMGDGSFLCDPCYYRWNAFREIMNMFNSQPLFSSAARDMVVGAIERYAAAHPAAQRSHLTDAP